MRAKQGDKSWPARLDSISAAQRLATRSFKAAAAPTIAVVPGLAAAAWPFHHLVAAAAGCPVVGLVAAEVALEVAVVPVAALESVAAEAVVVEELVAAVVVEGRHFLVLGLVPDSEMRDSRNRVVTLKITGCV